MTGDLEASVKWFQAELGRQGTIDVLGTDSRHPHHIAVRAYRLGWNDAMRTLPVGPPYTIEGCEHCAGCGEVAWDCVCVDEEEP